MTRPANRRIGPPNLPPSVRGQAKDVPSIAPTAVDAVDARYAEGSRRGAAFQAPRGPRGKAWAITRALLGGALAVGVSTVVAVAARRYVSTSPRFAVTEVVVTGAKQRATGDLIALAGFEKGKNIFSADLDGARDRLLADPWLKDVALARRLPGTLYIDVVEREAAAILNLEDTYLISRDGELIKRLEGHDPGDLTVITGVEPDHYARDKKGAEQEIRSALDLADEYEASLMGKRYPLQAVHVQRGGEMTLLVGKTSVALVMGKKPYRGKLEQAAKVLQEVEHQGAQADAVMLDNEARPDRIVVRMR